MWQIFIGSLILSIIHTSIPNHWIPLIALSHSEKWSRGETLSATVIAGFAHTLSTVAVGITVGIIGYKLTERYSFITDILAPAILIIMGIIYLWIDLKKSNRHSHATQAGSNIKEESLKAKSKSAIIISLSIAMFLTPCTEIEAFYFQAGTIGWTGIFIVSIVYTLTTIGLMSVLVYMGTKEMKKLNFHYLEHHEKQMTGTILVILGLSAYFV